MEFYSKVSGGPQQTALQVHVPEEVARHLNLAKGDHVVWVVENQTVTIKKKF